jgi:Na+/H+ antiporter
MGNVALIIVLLFGITFLAVLSKKYNFPFPIVLVLSGIAISLIPGLPVISIRPEIIFLIFLPPLLHEAAWNTNWHNFRENKRPIMLAAFGLVLFTTLVVGMAAHYFIPNISWALGFLLGAIVSPTDAVSVASLTKNLGLSPKVITIIEGESIVNDASGLVAYKYAISAVMAGNFVFWQAGLNFLVVIAGSVAVGLVIGYCAHFILKKIPFDAVLLTAFTFLIPFSAYLLAEHFELSGVLAVVCSSFYLSYNSESIIANESRITIYAVWDVVTFILNSLIFILIGLELKDVLNGIVGYSVFDLIIYGLLISFAVIIARFVFVIPAALLPRKISKTIRETETFSSKNMIVVSWAGIRGVISLAAALSLPLMLPNGDPFPKRDLIIYLTFCVILTTLLLLGLNLPVLIRKLKIIPYSIVAEEYEARNIILNNTIDHINQNLTPVKKEYLDNIKYKYEVKQKRIEKTDLPNDYFEKGRSGMIANNMYNEYSKLEVDLIDVERNTLLQLQRTGKISEKIFRKIERELDLEETRIRLEMYL